MPAVRTASTALATVVLAAGLAVSSLAASPAAAAALVPATSGSATTTAFVGPVASTSSISAARLRVAQARRTCVTASCTNVRKRHVLAGGRVFTGPLADARKAKTVVSPSPAPVTTTAPAPTGSLTTPTTEPVPTATPLPATKQWGAVAFRGEVNRFTKIGSYAYLQLNAWEADKAAVLKASHPGLKVLVYKDMSSTRSYAVRDGQDHAELPTGVGYLEAKAASPEWFLKDTTGAQMEWPYSGHWWMDVANRDYQARWLANVKADLAAGPWDGVVIDNVMASPEWYLNGRTIAKYPTKATYAAATESFLQAVAPQLTATGTLVMGNISDASPSTWDRWVGLLSGGNHEHSFSWNGGQLYGGGSWLERVEEIERTQRAGRIHTATSSATSTDVRALTYIRASWLMAWDGGGTGAAQMVALKDQDDPWNAIIGTDLGKPVTARTAVGGAWRRDFTGGTTLANPSTASVTVPLGRSMVDLGGNVLTSVTLAPLTGALLLNR